MGMVTAGTDKAADTEKELSGGCFQGTDIVAMNGKAARVTGTFCYHIKATVNKRSRNLPVQSLVSCLIHTP